MSLTFTQSLSFHETRSYTLMVTLLLEKIRYKYTFPQNATMVTSPKPSNMGKVANRPHYLLNVKIISLKDTYNYLVCTASNRWYRSRLQGQSCCQSSVILAQIGKTVQFKMACAHQQTFANSFRNITIKYEFNPFHSCLFWGWDIMYRSVLTCAADHRASWGLHFLHADS